MKQGRFTVPPTAPIFREVATRVVSALDAGEPVYLVQRPVVDDQGRIVFVMDLDALSASVPPAEWYTQWATEYTRVVDTIALAAARLVDRPARLYVSRVSAPKTKRDFSAYGLHLVWHMVMVHEDALALHWNLQRALEQAFPDLQDALVGGWGEALDATALGSRAGGASGLRLLWASKWNRGKGGKGSADAVHYVPWRVYDAEGAPSPALTAAYTDPARRVEALEDSSVWPHPMAHVGTLVETAGRPAPRGTKRPHVGNPVRRVERPTGLRGEVVQGLIRRFWAAHGHTGDPPAVHHLVPQSGTRLVAAVIDTRCPYAPTGAHRSNNIYFLIGDTFVQLRCHDTVCRAKGTWEAIPLDSITRTSLFGA